MRRKPYSFRPESIPLESKVLLSLAASPAPQTGDPAEVTTLATTTLGASTQANNAIKGQYFAAEDNRAADAPLDVKLDGDGKVRGLGSVELSGSIQFGGFLMANQPDINGTVTLTNAKGSVTLRLTGRGGHGEVADSTFNLTASVVKGTGAYKNFRRIGTATAKFGPNTVQSIAAPSPIGGKLTLSFNLRPPIR